MLGLLGRGFTDISLHKDLIFDQMVHMLRKASMPILTDVKFFATGDPPSKRPFPGILDMFPRTLPELYGGSPIVITGTYKGSIPPMSVSGRDAYGRVVVLMCKPVQNDRVSIKQVCAKAVSKSQMITV